MKVLSFNERTIAHSAGAVVLDPLRAARPPCCRCMTKGNAPPLVQCQTACMVPHSAAPPS
jgi:hypothetical protein